MQASSDSDVLIARFGAPFGIKGWIKAKAYTEDPASIANYGLVSFLLAGAWVSREIVAANEHKGSVIVKLEGVIDRNQAELYRGLDIYVRRDQFEELDDGTYYQRDLLNLTVKNLENETLGTVCDFMETGASTVLVLKTLESGQLVSKERLVPFVQGVIVKEVNLLAQMIVVDWSLDY